MSSSLGKRKEPEPGAAPRNESGKVLFVRDAQGELLTVMPGDLMPSRVRAATEDAVAAVAEAEDAVETARLAARSAEDIQYEAYMGGRDAKKGNVWIAGAGVASTDRAAFCDSISAQVAEEREASGKEYAPSRAHDRSHKIKSQRGAGSAGSYGGGLSVEEARVGASAAAAALARAKEASDDDDDDGNLPADQLAVMAMACYNTPISNLPQLDPYGNDLRVPQLERKLRKFLECFGEEAMVTTVEGTAVLKDFEALRKRYGTVFRESGASLKGALLKRFVFEIAADGDGVADDDDDDGGGDDEEGDETCTFCLDFERHSDLVTPRIQLDGSLGCHPPRTQDLVVLYRANEGEISGMWIAPDKAALGSDPEATRDVIEQTDLYRSFRRLVARLSGGRLSAQFHSYL